MSPVPGNERQRTGFFPQGRCVIKEELMGKFALMLLAEAGTLIAGNAKATDIITTSECVYSAITGLLCANGAQGGGIVITQSYQEPNFRCGRISAPLCPLGNLPLRPHLDLLRPDRFRTCRAVELLLPCGLSPKTLKFSVSRAVARSTVAAPANGWGRDSLPCL